jgi:uncharacterized protein with PQ loop repeat
MPFIYLFTLVGTAIGLVRGLPQLARLLRSRNAHGVSVDAAATSSIVSFAWATYEALTDQIAVVLASGSSALVFMLVALGALRFGRGVPELRMAPIWLALLLAVGLLGGVDRLALLLSVSVLVANGPQVRVAWNERDLSGLSLGTWLLSVTEAAAWGSYGFLAGDRSILVYGVLHFLTSGTIVVLRLMKGGRSHLSPA